MSLGLTLSALSRLRIVRSVASASSGPSNVAAMTSAMWASSSCSAVRAGRSRYPHVRLRANLPDRPHRAVRGRDAIHRADRPIGAASRGGRCDDPPALVAEGDYASAYDLLDGITNDGTIAVDTATLVELVLLGQAIRAT